MTAPIPQTCKSATRARARATRPLNIASYALAIRTLAVFVLALDFSFVFIVVSIFALGLESTELLQRHFGACPLASLHYILSVVVVSLVLYSCIPSLNFRAKIALKLPLTPAQVLSATLQFIKWASTCSQSPRRVRDAHPIAKVLAGNVPFLLCAQIPRTR